MKKDLRWKFIFLIITLAACFYFLYPTIKISGMTFSEQEKYEEENPEAVNNIIKLGLDLQGGTRLVMELDTAEIRRRTQKGELDGKNFKENVSRALDQSLEIIRNRVDQFGVSEPVIQKNGLTRIIVELPGVHNIERARELIKSTARLQFKLLMDPEDLDYALRAVDKAILKELHKKPSSEEKSAENEKETAAEKSPEDKESIKEHIRSSIKEEIVSETDVSTGDEPETIDEIRKERPFTSLLTSTRDNNIAVMEENIEEVKELFKNPEVRNAVPAGGAFVWDAYTQELEDGRKFRKLYYLKEHTQLSGESIEEARENIGQSGLESNAAIINMKFDPKGSKRFSRLTGANIGKRLAIVLDSAVYMAPVIKDRISGGSAQITGLGSMEEARDIAIILRAGALPVSLNIIQERTVGPSLGQDAINRGISASIYAFLIIIAFKVLYYRGAGIIADTALMINFILVAAILSRFGFTLTLPGIAGLILTIGMAVDANVIIFERIKEELALGKTVRSSIATGYEKAIRTIIDANLTTLFTAMILLQFGTGPIKGFAWTLSIGIICSVFTAVFVSRWIFEAFTRKPEIKKLSI
ncbi:MAG: protein translocase subunit SecD [Fibrobacterota bacterium]